MATMSAKEIRLIKEILQALNQEFPPKPIPITTWKDNKLVKITSTQDQHFNAYKVYQTNGWWLTCNNYEAWSEAYQFMIDYCKLFKLQTGVSCRPCHTHPVFDAAKKRDFNNKKCFWIGVLTWTEV
jgi:hypothetical protein